MGPGTALAAVCLLGLLGTAGCGREPRRQEAQRKARRFSALMDELGPQGFDLKPFIEASERSRRLASEGRHAQAEAVLDEAIRGLEGLKPGALAAASPLDEDWAWSEALGGREQAEPLADELALVVSDADYPHIPGFLGAMSGRGIRVVRAGPADLAALGKARIVAVLGSARSGDGVGALVRRLLSGRELAWAAEGPGIFVKWNVFRPRQGVVVMSAASPERLGQLAVEQDVEVYQRVKPPLTRKGHPRFDGVHAAVSEDGVRWRDEGPALLRGASVPEIVALGAGWRLYFIDGQSGGPGCAYSGDGRTWRFERLRVRDLRYGGGPGVADPNIVRLDDGRWRMYFDSGARPGLPANEGLLSAVSDDGLSFAVEEGVRYAEPGLADPEVHKMGGVWRLFYPGRDAGRVATAVSRDGGLTFEREAVLDLRSAGSFDVVAVDGGWRMYLNSGRGMLVYRSGDGLDWRADGEVAFEARNAAVARLPGGGWRMYYNK